MEKATVINKVVMIQINQKVVMIQINRKILLILTTEIIKDDLYASIDLQRLFTYLFAFLIASKGCYIDLTI